MRAVCTIDTEGYARVMAISTCAGRIGESMVSPPYDRHVNLIARARESPGASSSWLSGPLRPRRIPGMRPDLKKTRPTCSPGCVHRI
jgi:hypothetical protein